MDQAKFNAHTRQPWNPHDSPDSYRPYWIPNCRRSQWPCWNKSIWSIVCLKVDKLDDNLLRIPNRTRRCSHFRSPWSVSSRWYPEIRQHSNKREHYGTACYFQEFERRELLAIYFQDNLTSKRGNLHEARQFKRQNFIIDTWIGN